MVETNQTAVESDALYGMTKDASGTEPILQPTRNIGDAVLHGIAEGAAGTESVLLPVESIFTNLLASSLSAAVVALAFVLIVGALLGRLT